MAFVETPRFPIDISFNSRFGPNFSTALAKNLGGYEARNKNWTYPLFEGEISLVRSQAQLDIIFAYFHYVAGMFNGFRFKNFNDYTVTGSEGTFIQLTGTTWQLCKTRTWGVLSTQWKVKKPIDGTVTITGGSWTVDYTTGIITAVGSPTISPTSWVGEFDFPIRFNIDKLTPQWLQSRNYYDLSSLPIIEIRL